MDDKLIELQTLNQYKMLIEECPLPLVFKFSAEFCGPCKALHPKYKELANKYVDKAIFLCIDIEDEKLKELVDEFNISSIPTMIVSNNKYIIKRTVGGGPNALKDIESAILSVIS
jgi:thioredoxin 1